MLNGYAPGFAPEGGLALALLRGVWLACLLSSFGAAVFSAAIGRAPRVARAGLAAAILAGLAWLAAQSADMAGAETAGAAAAAIPAVLGSTLFGRVLAAQLALLAAALAAGRARGPALALSGAALAAQAWHSHAWSMYGRPSVLAASDAAHLLAAGAWLGGLPPLALLVRAAPPAEALRAARAFSPLGIACVATILVTAGFQGWTLSGGAAGIVGTAYGWVMTAKAALLAVLIAFAAAHRRRLTPALAGADPAGARARLGRSIAMEACVGLAVALAAGLLASLPPGMHVQPVWPFAERFSLDAVREDADFRREAIGGALAMGGAFALLALAGLARRWTRLGAAAAACGTAWLAAPHLDLLFAQAYPTSFAHSPTMFAADAIAEGAALYPEHCASCHGARGRGDGPLARGLTVPPADLTAAHLWMHSDGEMLWWLTHGIEGPDGGLVMPGFADALSEEQRWDLIDAVRARNAGVAFASTHGWPVPVQAPDFQMACDGRTVLLSDLRGAAALVTITAGGAAVRQGPRACAADDGAIPAAYALVTGADAAAGAALLIDGDGYLRAMRPPGDASWDDPARLAAEIAAVEAHPLAPPAAAPMDMSGGMRM